jgi:hypothetical protein
MHSHAISHSPPASGYASEVIAMLDVVLLAIGVGFFVASVLYVLACEGM